MDYTYTEERFELNQDTNKFELTEKEERTVDSQYYYNCCGANTLKWFRNLGGTEILRHSGKKHTLTSYSPSKEIKVIRTFVEQY